MQSSYRLGISLIVGSIFLFTGTEIYQDNSEGKADTTDWTQVIEPKVIDKVGDKAIAKYEEGYIEAVGAGTPPEQYYGKPQVRPMALRAAQLDSYRNLLESVKGVQIDSTATVIDFAVESDVINTSVSGLVKDAEIVNKTYLFDSKGHQHRRCENN
jgi:hypothetical protein